MADFIPYFDCRFAKRLIASVCTTLALMPVFSLSAMALTEGANSAVGEERTPIDPPGLRGSTTGGLNAQDAQTADILGIRQEVERLNYLRHANASESGYRSEQLRLRGKILRKIMQAVFQVQAAEDRLESEMAWAYDMQARQRRKVDRVNQGFNAFNFAQLGILYGIIEPYSRIHKQFTQSAVGTCVGSGLAIGLPVLNIMYNRFLGGVGNYAPPGFMAYMIDGKPVDGSNLPPLVARYLDTAAPGAALTRRQSMSALWKKRYSADLDKSSTLAGLEIDPAKKQKPSVLNTRIVLLWSLFTNIQNFDKDLLALLENVSNFQPVGEGLVVAGRITPGLSGGAGEAAALLGITPLIEELRTLADEPTESERKIELRTRLLEAILVGYLDMQIARDRCQEEMNYQYDVVMAQMLARRGRFLQKTYEANFIQTGTLGACAGWSYLNHYGKAGNQLFAVENAIGLGITTVSLAATHGGWRKNESGPNSLADFFNLRANGTHGFSPLVWNFINNPSSEEPGKSRRQYLRDIWNKSSIAETDLSKPKNLEKLASMPSCKWDTIKLVKSRIVLLVSLSEQFCRFDQELLDLLNQIYPGTGGNGNDDATGEKIAAAALSSEGEGAATLLAVHPLLFAARTTGKDTEGAKLEISRSLLGAFLDTSANANLLTHEIVVETQVVSQLAKYRDMAIQYTNIANFYQIGILGIISDGLGLCSKSKYVLYGDRLNLVSGGLILGLALGTIVESHGGVRLSKATPSLLNNAFGRTSNVSNLSPLMVKFLDSKAPRSSTNLTRRNELVKYWKESKLLNVNVERPSTVDKLCAEGRGHNWLSETINLINNRITMLYDLRAVLRSSNAGFDEVLRAVD